MDKSATVIIESKYYDKEIASAYFSSVKYGAGFSKTFEPNSY